MRMTLAPSLFLALGCPICGEVPGAGTTSVNNKYVIDVNIHCSGNPSIPTPPRPCPKCGIESYPSWEVRKIKNRFYIRGIYTKQLPCDWRSDPLCIWEAKALVKKMKEEAKHGSTT